MTRAPLRNSLALALTLTAALAVLVQSAASAGAQTFGGLGRIGEVSIKGGSEKGHLEIGETDAFVLEEGTGDFYVADRVEIENKKGEEEELTRIQKFNGKGEALAEKLINPPNAHELELRAITLNAEKHMLYVLVEGVREGTKYDNEKDAAVEILSFSTQGEELKEEKPLVEKNTLAPYSDKAKASLIEPAAIAVAVDPATHEHEILISAQQDEDTEANAQLRAVIQPVLENGTLGPRYVDSNNCLDSGEHAPGEPACEELQGEHPVSLVATQGGRALVEMQQEQLWEIPMPASGSKEVPVIPRRRFVLPSTAPAEDEVVKGFSGEEEQSDTIAYAPAGAEEGYIYAGVELSPSREAFTSGVMRLKASEHASELTIGEMGWTGGAGATSKQPRCEVPISNSMPLEVAGSAEQVDVFTGIESEEPQSGRIVSEPVIEQFGSAPGAEACGHVEVTTPTIKIGNGENLTEVKAGPEAKATLSSKVEGADALATSWKIVRRVGGKVESEETLSSSEYLGKEAVVSYTFALPGEYEITETVTTDNLATPTRQVVRNVKAVLQPITFKIEPVSALPAEGLATGTAIKLRAKLADPNESGPHLPHLQLTWRFGDGATVGPLEVEGSEGAYTAEVEHAFTSTCGGACSVTLEAKDTRGAEGHGELKLSMYTPPPTTTTTTTTTTPTTTKGNGGVLPEQVVHNPEAKIAGSTSLSVRADGAVALEVSCPAKESECAGTVTLQTVVAQSAKKHGKPKKVTVTLARGSFVVTGGASKVLTLHLSAQGRALLAHSRTLHASAVLVAHDSANVTRRTTAGVTLRLAVTKGAKKKR